MLGASPVPVAALACFAPLQSIMVAMYASEDNPQSDFATSKPASKERYNFGVVSTATRKSMQSNKRRDTKPEVKLRQLLRRMGYTGYRTDWAKAPGRPDVALLLAPLPSVPHGCAEEERGLLGGEVRPQH